MVSLLRETPSELRVRLIALPRPPRKSGSSHRSLYPWFIVPEPG